MSQSTPLHEQACEKCKSKGGAPEKLSDEEVQKLSAQICPSWQVVKKGDGDAISRSFVAKNFQAALDYVVAVGAVAGAAGVAGVA